MYAPYAVVAGLSGVLFRSSSVMPHCAQYALCDAASLMTLRIVSVAAFICGKSGDLAPRRLYARA